jgi:ABC-type branched-subunit amino acid transport system substrate-binding protein
VFPNTELPASGEADYGYSLYFSRGLELEAEALSRYLGAQTPIAASIVQIYDDSADGTTPAAAFERATRAHSPGTRVDSVKVTSGGEMARAILETRAQRADALVLWPGRHQEAALAALSETKSAVKIVSLPSDALESAERGARKALPQDVVFTYPYELPTVYNSRVFRVRQWMNSRNLEIRYPRLQLQAYYALTLIQYGLEQILDDYFRDYLIEAIEHEAESHLDNGTHPTLALGPGQRFASKGAYVVQLEAGAEGNIRAVSDWIVP